MKLISKKTTKLSGQATPPSSKSDSIRAILLAAMSQGDSILTNVLQADDTEDALQAAQQLGAQITKKADTLVITGNALPLRIANREINTGNSGITTHFIMPILGLRQNAHQPIILNCGDQMRERPIQPLVDALRNLGLHITYLENNKQLPISLTGELKGGKTTVAGMTSQYLSALLLTLPCAAEDSEITVSNLKERPYVDMTLNYLQEQGIQYSQQRNAEIDIYKIKGRQTYKSFCKAISCDFSSASYLIAAAALIPGEIILDGLDMNANQGDKQLVYILQEMGADIRIAPKQIHIRGGKKLQGITIDAKDIPDLLPTLAVIGTYATGTTKITNVAHARIKETDRIHSMTQGLQELGAHIHSDEDSLTIYESVLKGNAVHGYDDHRTVMALSIAGLIATGTTIISGAHAVNKTFPTFIAMMQALGAKMEVENGSSC